MENPVRSPVAAVVRPYPCCPCCRDGGMTAHEAPYNGHNHPCAVCQSDQLRIGEGE